MAFNPISIDDDGALLDHHHHHNQRDGNTTISHTNSNARASKAALMGPYTPTTSVPKAVRMLRHHYLMDLNWAVAMPHVPDSPLLYYPAEYTELLTNPAAIGVMQSELDAMECGVLEAIPLAFYPLKPGVVAEARHAAAETAGHTAAASARVRASGQLERVLLRPEDANHPSLTPGDRKLLESELGSDSVLSRENPSLTLLQRPLYTDMGLVSQEERHRERLARIVPQELRHLSCGAGLPGSPLSPGSPVGGGGGGVVQLAAAVFETDAEAEAKRKGWVEEVSRSFRQVRAIDVAFDRFLEALTSSKLGLDGGNARHLELARAMWCCLYGNGVAASSNNKEEQQQQQRLPVRKQREVWHALCHFSFTYDDASPAAAEQALLASVQGRRLPRFDSLWRPLLCKYVAAVREHTAALPGGAAGRRALLRFSDVEIDPQASADLTPDVHVGGALQRRGKALGSNHAPLPIFPVEVIPVFPSGFARAGRDGVTPARSADGALDYLAEGAASLRHVILPGATIPVAARSGPHILVGDTNLLVADAASSVADTAAGAAVSYSASVQNTYECLFYDQENTSSYVLRIHGPTSHGQQQEQELRGATSKDGAYITYDRIGWRDVYAKAPNVRAPAFRRHVLVYPPAPTAEGEETEVETTTTTGGKRSREAPADNGVNANPNRDNADSRDAAVEPMAARRVKMEV